MKFSVIVPAHNEQAVIAKALSSIRQQTSQIMKLLLFVMLALITQRKSQRATKQRLLRLMLIVQEQQEMPD